VNSSDLNIFIYIIILIKLICCRGHRKGNNKNKLLTSTQNVDKHIDAHTHTYTHTYAMCTRLLANISETFHTDTYNHTLSIHKQSYICIHSYTLSPSHTHTHIHRNTHTLIRTPLVASFLYCLQIYIHAHTLCV